MVNHPESKSNPVAKHEHNASKEFAKILQDKEKDTAIENSLKEMYASAPRTDAPVAGLQRRHTSPLKKLGWTFVLFLTLLVALSWAGFYLLHQGTRLQTDDIIFAVTGPGEIVVGKEEVFEIQYKNISDFVLQDVTIRLDAPASFVFIDAVPAIASDDPLVWKMDTIPVKRSGRIAVKAKLTGLVDTPVNLRASLQYRPENFSSFFSAQSEWQSTIKSTGFNVSVEAPSFANVKEEIPITVRYVKQRESFTQPFVVLLEHGDSFQLTGKDQTAVWPVDNATETPQELIIKGAYTKKPPAGETLTVRLATAKAVTVTRTEGDRTVTEEITEYAVWYEQPLDITVVDGALSLTLSLNGALVAKPVNFSDTLAYVVHYKNSSDATLRNIVIMALVDSALVDWNALQNPAGGDRMENSLLWTKSEIADLATLAPDEEGSFSFSLKLKDAAPANIAPNDLSVRAALDYSIDSELTDTEVHAIELASPVNTAVSFNTSLRYFDEYNNTVGAGPLPPKVGEKTTYQAFISLAAGMHDLKDATVTTVLPANAAWENNFSSTVGTVAYDSGTREVRWRLPSVDTAGEPAMLDFAVSITPGASERNKTLTILSQTILEAVDAQTGGTIRRQTSPKTTALEDDAAGRGQGVVR